MIFGAARIVGLLIKGKLFPEAIVSFSFDTETLVDIGSSFGLSSEDSRI